MQPYTGNDGNLWDILEKCRTVDVEIDQLDSQLNELEIVVQRVLARPDKPLKDMESLNSQIMTSNRKLVDDLKTISLQPGSRNYRNKPQVDRLKRKLNEKLTRYDKLQAHFKKTSQAAAKRQYGIAHPEATENEINQAVADPNAPIFQQAVCAPFHVLLIATQLLTLCLASPPWPSQLFFPRGAKAPQRHQEHRVSNG